MTCNFDKDELILKVLDGVATPEEILMLSRWLEEDPAFEVYFNQLKKAWNVMSGPLPSKEREEKELCRYVEYIHAKHKRYRLHRVYKYAAILILPLLVSIYWLQKEQTVENTSSMAVAMKIEPGECKATLTTATGNVISLIPTKQGDIQIDERIKVTNGQAGIVYNETKSA